MKSPEKAWEEFLAQQKKKRDEELAKVDVKDKSTILKMLNKHYEDKTPAAETMFTRHEEKTSGISAGYVAKRNSDGSIFMIKTASMSPDRKIEDTIGFVLEFMTSPFYKRTLYDRAPLIELVDSVNTNTVQFRSKFLHNFQTVAQFTGAKYDDFIGPKAENLKNVQGAEKLFAAILFCGEVDMHAGNIGVMEVTGDDDKPIQVFAKIDHGRSAWCFFSDPAKMMERFAIAWDEFGYAGKINLNVTKFKEAIDEIANISDQEIDTFIEARISQLEARGFNIKDITFYAKQDEVSIYDPGQAVHFNSFVELKEYYIKQYTQQIKTLKELSKRLASIEKIQHDSPEWKDGKWLQDIGGQDPDQWRKDKQVAVAAYSIAQRLDESTVIRKFITSCCKTNTPKEEFIKTIRLKLLSHSSDTKEMLEVTSKKLDDISHTAGEIFDQYKTSQQSARLINKFIDLIKSLFGKDSYTKFVQKLVSHVQTEGKNALQPHIRRDLRNR